MRRTWGIVIGVIGAILVAVTLIDPLAFVADDSWFYLVIGRNIVDGRGITFSGVMGTNGFQPLWQAVVTSVIGLCQVAGIDSPEGQARGVLLAAAALLVVLVLLTGRLLRRLEASETAIGITLLGLVVGLGGVLGTIGSEANLVAVLLVLSVGFVLDVVESGSPRRSILAGVFLGLMVLGRLDTGFVAAAALGAICAFGSAPLRTRLVLAGSAGSVAAVIVAPYLLWNQVRFGHLMPIAGDIKLDTSTTLLNWSAIGRFGVGLLVGIVVLLPLAWAGRRPSRDAVLAVGVPFLGGAVSAAIYVLWAPGRFTDLDWYRMPLLLAGAMLVAAVVTRLDQHRPNLTRLGVVTLSALLVSGALFVAIERRARGANHRFWHPVAEFSTRVGDEVPAAATVASVDFPGVLAMYSDRDVVALDGLTGDFAFQDDLRDRGANCALARRNVRYLVVDDSDRLRPVPGGYEVEVGSWLYKVSGGTLRLDPSDRVIADRRSDLSLWRVRLRCSG